MDKVAEGAGRDRRRTDRLTDPARLELVNLTMLENLAAGSAVASRQGDATVRPARYFEQAVLVRELARRRGDATLLARAEQAAARAAGGAIAGGRLFAAARLQGALCAMDRAQAFAEAGAWPVAKTRLAQAEAAFGRQPSRLAEPTLLRARLMGADALGSADRAAMLAAIAVFDQAIATLEASIRATGEGLPDSAFARCERAELMIAMGLRLKETGLLDRAISDLGALTQRLDVDDLPLSWARAATLQGVAMRLLGETTGEARLMKDAANALRAALAAIPSGHSPMDRARAAHGLGLALQGWGEITGEMELYRSALLAFDHALAELAPPGPPLRAIIAHDRAACLARQAERSGDSRALAEAEAAFRAELTVRPAARDPVAWAVTQVALARIYESRADLLGDHGERADAAFALTEAMDVFSEKGLRSLCEVASAALARLRAAV